MAHCTALMVSPKPHFCDCVVNPIFRLPQGKAHPVSLSLEVDVQDGRMVFTEITQDTGGLFVFLGRGTHTDQETMRAGGQPDGFSFADVGAKRIPMLLELTVQSVLVSQLVIDP